MGFKPLTPLPDLDVVVVRERSYGASGVDLTAYGMPGAHDYVQSICVRAYHGVVNQRRVVRGRLISPPEVSILGVIHTAADLGGTLDDGVLKASDAEFAIGSLPDDYSARLRGIDDPSVVEHNWGGPSWIAAWGSTAFADNGLWLSAQDMSLHAVGYFINSMTTGHAPGAGGSQGTLSLSGHVGRHDALVQSSGNHRSIRIQLDWTHFPQPSGFISVNAGETWHFQCWHRDLVGGAPTSNFTGATAVTFL